MKIAFLGKGGSGKSTITSIFSYLLSKKNKVVVFDADLNIHIEKKFDTSIDKTKYISDPKNIEKIKKYLTGNNQKIDYKKMVKTTPPGKGSNFFEIEENNYIIKNFSKKINKNLYLINIGSYEGEKAGLSCYHTNLGVFENILSHSKLKKDEYIISDMVAGIDSLANTLFIQFDIYFFIIEPNFESLDVYKKFIEELNKTPFKDQNIYLIVNKIEDETDKKFIETNLKKHSKIIYFYKNPLIKKIAQNIASIKDIEKDNNINQLFLNLLNLIKKVSSDPNKKLKQLIELHKNYAQLDYVKRANGDITNQIDPDFKF